VAQERSGRVLEDRKSFAATDTFYLFIYLFIYLSGLSELSDGYCSEKLAVELNPLCPRRSDKRLTDRGRPKPKSCFTLHQVAM